MSWVTMRKDGKYYRVPVEALYKDEKQGAIQYTSRVPVKEYTRGQRNTFRATIALKRVRYQMALKPEDYYGYMYKIIGTKREELQFIQRAIQHMGGLRFKTKKGIDIQVKGNIENGECVIARDHVYLKNPHSGGSTVELPNVFPRGDICWGNVKVPKGKGLDFAEVLFSRFITSRFNTDIVRHTQLQDVGGYMGMLKKRYKELEEQTDNEDVLRAREFYISKIERKKKVGAFINLEVSTLFDLDNMVVDAIK